MWRYIAPFQYQFCLSLILPKSSILPVTFTLKFWILLAAQITYSMNRTFLSFQCISFDFLLRIGLNMDQWLCACVAVERAVTTIKGIHFNQKKSKKIARYIIFSLLFFTTITTIHDPIHRKLIDDGNEQRIWCIVSYSSSAQIYNSIINIFHFIVPFGINILSAITIIITMTRLRNRNAPQQGYQEILQKEIRRHSRILIAPVVLIIFTTPRLILSLVSGCMKSIDDAWIFIIGYYVSFLPPILTFLVFVLPSKTYKKKFRKSMRQFRILLQTRLHLNIGL